MINIGCVFLGVGYELGVKMFVGVCLCVEKVVICIDIACLIFSFYSPLDTWCFTHGRNVDISHELSHLYQGWAYSHIFILRSHMDYSGFKLKARMHGRKWVGGQVDKS